MPSTVTADFSTINPDRADFKAWGGAHINIRDYNLEGPGDAALQTAIGTRITRCFVRLEQWAGDPWPANPIDTDPAPNFTLGDSWITEINARGLELWVIHEGLVDMAWLGLDSGAGFTTGRLDTYEDVLVEIYAHIKTVAPSTVIFEMLNEPFLSINGSFDGAQVYELMKRNGAACTRVNNLGLPGPPIRNAGPAATYTHWQNDSIIELVDAIAADSVAWDATVKPDLAYWTAHSFHNAGVVDLLIDPASTTNGFGRGDTLAAASTHPTMLDGIPRAVTAYSRESNQGFDTADPDRTHMARQAAFYVGFAEFAHRYSSPVGDRIEECVMFAKSNYVDYGNSMIRPFELAANFQVTWGGVDGIETPVYNAALMESMIAVGSGGERVAVTGSGDEWYETFDPVGKKGLTATAVRQPGSSKVWVFLQRHRFGSQAERAVTVNFDNLAGAGIDTAQAMTYSVWALDRDQSNVGNGVINAPLAQTVTDAPLTASASQQIVVQMRSPAAFLIELTGAPVAGGSTTALPGTATAAGVAPWDLGTFISLTMVSENAIYGTGTASDALAGGTASANPVAEPAAAAGVALDAAGTPEVTAPAAVAAATAGAASADATGPPFPGRILISNTIHFNP